MNKPINGSALRFFRKKIIILIFSLCFFDQSKALREGDSVLLRSQEGKYLSSLNVMAGAVSAIGFVNVPDAGSRWIIRRLDSASTGLEIPNGQSVRVFFQNAVTGGNIVWRVGLYNQFLDNETQAPIEDWSFHGISKLTGFVQGHACDIALYDIVVNDNKMTISTINVAIPARRGKVTQNYYIGQLPGSDILRIGNRVGDTRFVPTFTIEKVQAPSFGSNGPGLIQRALAVRMFKQLPGRASKGYCFYTGKGKLHTFVIASPVPGDSLQGYLYKLAPDDKTWMTIYTSIPFVGEGGASPVVTNVWGNADGQLMISGAGNSFIAKHNDVERLNFTHPGGFLSRVIAYGNDDRFWLLPQNCAYAYYKKNRYFFGARFDGQTINTMWDQPSFTQGEYCKGYLALEDSQLPMVKTATSPDGKTLTVKIELIDGKRKITFIDGNGAVTTYPLNPNVGPYVRFKRDTSTNVEGWPIYVECDGYGNVWAQVGNNWRGCFIRASANWLEWGWTGQDGYAPFFEGLKQRTVRTGAGNTLLANKINQNNKNLLIHDGQKWADLPTPDSAGLPVCVDTDDDGNFWFMDKTGNLFIRQGAGWSAVSGFDPNVLGDTLYKFSVAGRADNINLVVLSVTGKVGIYSGPIGSLKIKDLSVGSAQVWGMSDACVASDGTMLLIFKDQNFDENGTIWRGSIALASNDENAAANLEALNAGDN